MRGMCLQSGKCFLLQIGMGMLLPELYLRRSCAVVVISLKETRVRFLVGGGDSAIYSKYSLDKEKIIFPWQGVQTTFDVD